MTDEASNLHVRVIDLEHGHRGLREDVDCIEEHLYGNGKLGLLTIVDRMEQKGIGHSKAVVAVCTVLAAVISGAVQLAAAMVAK